MIKYAILGFGVVGGGLAEVMADQREKLAAAAGEEMELGYILVRHDYPDSPWRDKLVRDFAVIEHDPDVAVVAEVIGGVGPAYEYSRRAILAGKSVVSSNKQLVAEHGAELAALAREHGVSYLFEGSVGGGIPLLRPLCRCLAANRIDEVYGILNGTTNYILTAMDQRGRAYADALRTAQELGYAEADPTADVEGIDACRKTAILADLSFGRNLSPEDIPSRGITAVAPADLELARAMGYTVKLLGRAARTEEGVCAFVEPHLVPESHILASVNGVMNACAIRGSAVGEVVLCGPGAGAHPTASAVAADIADAVRHRADPQVPDLGTPGDKPLPADELCSRWYVRAKCGPEAVSAAFPGAEPVYGSTGECGFLTAMLDRRQLEKKLAAVDGRAAYRVLA